MVMSISVALPLGQLTLSCLRPAVAEQSCSEQALSKALPEQHMGGQKGGGGQGKGTYQNKRKSQS